MSEEQSQLYRLLGFLESFVRWELADKPEARKKLADYLEEVGKALEVKRG